MLLDFRWCFCLLQLVLVAHHQHNLLPHSGSHVFKKKALHNGQVLNWLGLILSTERCSYQLNLCDVDPATEVTGAFYVNHPEGSAITPYNCNENEGMKKVSCMFCHRKFWNKTDCQGHMNSRHLNIKPFSCGKCSMKFSYKQNWRKHEICCGSDSSSTTFVTHSSWSYLTSVNKEIHYLHYYLSAVPDKKRSAHFQFAFKLCGLF